MLFDGATIYVSAADDPQYDTGVVFFDLSNLKKIKCDATGAVFAYSTYMIDFKNDTLLSYGTSNPTVYRKDGNRIVTVCSILELGQRLSENYKASLIDGEHGLIGYAGYNIIEGEQYFKYSLFEFDGSELKETVSVVFESDGLYNPRACLIDGYLYIFNGEEFIVEYIGD